MAENTLSVLKIAPGQHPQQVEILLRPAPQRGAGAEVGCDRL